MVGLQSGWLKQRGTDICSESCPTHSESADTQFGENIPTSLTSENTQAFQTSLSWKQRQSYSLFWKTSNILGLCTLDTHWTQLMDIKEHIYKQYCIIYTNST